MPSVPRVGRVFSPLDEALHLLPGHTASPRLLELIARLGTWFPFEQVPVALAFLTGAAISADTARRWTEESGKALVAVEADEVERLERTSPPVPDGAPVQQLSADGAMVPLTGGVWAEVRTVAIGTVTQRTNRDGEQEPHCTDLSYFSRLTDAETFTRLATIATHRRGTEHAGTVVGVMDGAPWLQSFLDMQCPDAVRILDFPHAAEHLSTAAHAVYGAGSDTAQAWLTTQLTTLKEKDPDLVLAALRALPAHGEAATIRDRELHYLETRRSQINYATFRHHGYPIGSGIVESANKIVIEDRMKRSGMHWKRESVNPMVALRAMERSGDWDERWVVIWQRQQDTIHEVRRLRGLTRIAARPQRTEPVSSPPAAPTPVRLGVLDGPPMMVNGKPTKHHPWR